MQMRVILVHLIHDGDESEEGRRGVRPRFGLLRVLVFLRVHTVLVFLRPRASSNSIDILSSVVEGCCYLGHP
jgi:hypothetical protein